jgi:hypothetical protein
MNVDDKKGRAVEHFLGSADSIEELRRAASPSRSSLFERVRTRGASLLNSRTTRRIATNVLASAGAWLLSYAAVETASSFGFDWTLQKLSQSIGLMLGALVGYRVGARATYVASMGLALATAAEYVMDVVAGQPAVRGMWPHLFLVAIGVLAAMGATSSGRTPPLATVFDEDQPAVDDGEGRLHNRHLQLLT